MSTGPHRPEPEADDGSLSIFGFDDEAWVGLMREAARPGDWGSVAGYHVLEEVSRGGQGVVFRARKQSSGRVVALKRLAAGSLAGSEARARFRREIEAEAALRHPNIVGFEGVEVVEGQPLLVMEWIDGRPADRWAREAGEAAGAARPVREVLAAFARVCDAVSYAHRRGVIHRDLKPSNILIDAAGEPHVLDFGLARWRQGAEHDTGVGPAASRLTRTEGFVGTPAYAAPEQLTAGPRGADVRADVYALGVVLYGMLTGRRPFEESEGDWERLLRAIREEAPAPPSRHDRRVGGEVDAIVLRAMTRDPERRYQSAHELTADVRRYLAGEPVEARRDSAWYVARKFLRRHRLAVGAAALVVLSLAGGMAGTTLGLVRAERRRVEAETAREQTQKVSDFQAAMLSGIDAEAMGNAIKQRFRDQVRTALERRPVGEGPDQRERTAEEIEAGLAAFDELAGAAHAVDVARGVMDEFVLARAADALETKFADQPLMQARLRFGIGQTYRDLGLYDAAEAHLRSALAIRRNYFGASVAHHQVAECLYNLAELMDLKGNRPEEESLFREALAMWRALYGEDHQMVARTLDALAGTLTAQGKFDEAESLLNAALRLNRAHCDEDDPEILSNLADLAVLLTKTGRLPEAEAVNRELLQKRRGIHGDRDPSVALTLFNLAACIESQGRHAEAEVLFGECLSVLRALHGDEHPLVAKAMYRQGHELAALGRHDEAEGLYRRALEQQLALLDDRHLDLRNTIGALAGLHQQRGDHDGAVALMREGMAIAGRAFPEGDPERFRYFSAMGSLGGALAKQAEALLPADRERALVLFKEAQSLISESFKGISKTPRGANPEAQRRGLQTMVTMYEFWHGVAPDQNWDDRAAEWRVELEKLAGP